MRDYNLVTGDSPTFFRYVDWILTVPLMCVEFYLLTRLAGATKSLLWKLIFASTWMLVCGYIGKPLIRVELEQLVTLLLGSSFNSRLLVHTL